MRTDIERANAEYLAVFGPGQRRSPRAVRDRFEAMLAAYGLPDGLKVEEVDASGVPALLVRMPGVRTDRVIVWLHSGGYILGSAHGHRQFAALLSQAAGAVVLLPDYRRAPEAVFPAAPDDSAAAVDWAVGRYGAPGTFLGGDSAGGALALGVLVRRRDGGLLLPAATALVSPLVDLTLTSPSLHEIPDVAVGPDGMRDVVAVYLAGIDPYDPMASPVYADLSGLPPLLVLVSNAEALRDDARRVAARAQAGNTTVDLHEYEGVPHAWPLFASFLPEGQRAIEEIAHFYAQVGGPASA